MPQKTADSTVQVVDTWMALVPGTSRANLSRLLESEELLRSLCELLGSDMRLVQLVSLERCHWFYWVEWHEGEIAELQQLAFTIHNHEITLLQEELWRVRMQEVTALEQDTTSFWNRLEEAHHGGWRPTQWDPPLWSDSETDSQDYSEPRRNARDRPWRSRSR